MSGGYGVERPLRVDVGEHPAELSGAVGSEIEEDDRVAGFEAGAVTDSVGSTNSSVVSRSYDSVAAVTASSAWWSPSR